MPTFQAPKPKAREETPEEKAAWLAIRKHINDLGLIEDQQFDLPGRIVGIAGDPENPDAPIWKKIKNRRTGVEEDQAFLKVSVKLDDPKFAALNIVKDMRISFFDGNLRGQPQKSLFRGQFYHIHRAATGREPSPGLVNGTEGFDPADYCNIPMRVFFLYQGRVKEGEEYYGTRANLKVWLDHFEPTVETIKRARAADDDDGYGDDQPSPFVPGPDQPTTVVTDSAPAAEAKPASAGDKPTPRVITDWERKFIMGLGRECGIDADDLENWSLELYGTEIADLSRRDGSSFIEALQRRRNEATPAETKAGDQLGLPV